MVEYILTQIIHNIEDLEEDQSSQNKPNQSLRHMSTQTNNILQIAKDKATFAEVPDPQN